MLTAALTITLAVAPVSAETPDRHDWPDASAVSRGAATVTLITGDVIDVAVAAPDRFAASVRPGPGRESVTFHTLEVDGTTLVLPTDVVPYVSAGTLDRRLFDVPALIAQGYDDDSMATLPLIVRYHPDGVATAGALTASEATVDLPGIDAVALAADKERIGELWAGITGAGGPRAATAPDGLAAGVAQVWLDGRVEPVLADSVPQIGAPQAWQAGYDGTGVTVAVLDTGVDEAHPDLVGKVREARNFTDSAGTDDLVGHGTHVAATVAGSGAASDGARPGVAPGADLLSGKVLNDFGFGFESWIIAGMQWAVDEGADIVNMSLGGGPTDGTDPLSEAVNQLSEDGGALFVISAGNEGADYAVGAPGAATAALTVGAVDSGDALAGFSSRGPRVVDDALKPEITAPGVGIVAARAAGTAMGNPVDDHHTAASGTSMAAPHVAGAAALLAQARPHLEGAALKDVLVSTAAPDPELSPFAQGGGRVDVARAVAQPVSATGVLNLGMHVKSTAPVPAELSYTNHGGSDVTLALAVELTNVDGGDPAGAAVSLGDEVTVPAEETVTVPVSVNLAELARGRHTGRITATGPDGVVARTTVAITVVGPTHQVTFRAVAADGGPTGVDVLMLHGDTPRTDHFLWLFEGQETTVAVEEGSYLLQGLISDFNPQFEQATLITDPELEISGDREVVLDAGAATPVRIETPKPSEQQAVFSYYVHRVMGNGRTVSHGVMHFSTVRQVNVTPTAPVAAGEYEFSSRWQLVAPMVRAHVPGVTDPLDLHLLHQSPVFHGSRSFPLVYAGAGTPDELAAAGVAGTAAVMDASDEIWEQEQIAAAADAGAEVAIIVRPPDFSPWTVWRPIGDREPIPALVAGHGGGQRLIARATGNDKPADQSHADRLQSLPLRRAARRDRPGAGEDRAPGHRGQLGPADGGLHRHRWLRLGKGTALRLAAVADLRLERHAADRRHRYRAGGMGQRRGQPVAAPGAARVHLQRLRPAVRWNGGAPALVPGRPSR
jgi:subtilisin family serine protease